MQADAKIEAKHHKLVVKSTCFDYEDVSAVESANVDKLIDKAFAEESTDIYEVRLISVT